MSAAPAPPAVVTYAGDIADVERALFGLAEIADLCNYPRTHKARLRKMLPPPDYQLQMGPIWTLETVRRWLERYPIVRQA